MRISDWSSDVCSSDLAIITLARDAGLTVRELPYAIDQWQADAESGKLTESFACGTAAVVTPVGKVTRGENSFTIGAGGPGQVTEMLKGKLVDIDRKSTRLNSSH